MKKIVSILLILIIFNIPIFVYSNDTQVYIDKNDIGSIYHRLTCRYIPKEYKAISVEEAFAQGYRSCPICEPAISDAEKRLKDEEYQERKEKAKELVNSINPSTNIDTTALANSDNRSVYITKNGSKFHISGCDDLDGTPHKLSVSEAQDKGYAPCKKCNPYGLATELYGTTTKEKDNYNILSIVIFIILALLIIYIIFNEKKYRESKMVISTTEIKHRK